MPDAPCITVPSAQSLMDAARGRTGLENFGSPSFAGGLEQFLGSMAEERALFTQEGIDRLVATLTDSLAQRLRIEDWYAGHPEIEAEQPVSPLLITGLPRTGTSAFANVLSIEPAFRPLRPWEQASPVPPPVAGEEANDPRRLGMIRSMEIMQRDHPEQMTMHLHEVDATTEDVQILRLDFRAQSFTAPLYGYHRWWRDQPMRDAYAYQKRVVKLLQSRRGPNRWLFKAPHYVFHLEDVMTAYPDARFVVTHRDPVKTLPSWASLLTSLFPPGTRERVAMDRFGAHLVEHQAIGMQRMIEARARIGEDRFLDIHHHHFVADPLGTLGRVYDFIGLPFAPETQVRMAQWSEDNRPGKHGTHRYTAAEFGLDEQAIRERFAFYTDRYDVRLEKIAAA
ncbi:sulfotransferase family protein [Novosphingobium bradum]|uniref:Sulfotransferase family protein n=1 Tax=Novosphingobium bradum TaxID=1737444 RepID=A0ABV7IQ29_9SPHN